MDAVSKCRHDDPINCCKLFFPYTFYNCNVCSMKITLFFLLYSTFYFLQLFCFCFLFFFYLKTIFTYFFHSFLNKFLFLNCIRRHTNYVSHKFFSDFHVIHFCPKFDNKKKITRTENLTFFFSLLHRKGNQDG